MDFWEFRKRKSAGGSQFWMADTIGLSEVLAAYRFRKALTEDSALTNLVNSSTYKLVNHSCDLNTDGFLVKMQSNQYLDNSTLRSAGIKTLIMRIASSSISDSAACPLTGNWGNNVGVWLSTPFATASFYYKNYGWIGVTHENGLSVDYDNGVIQGTLARKKVRIGTGLLGNGVFGFNLDDETLYKDGSTVSLSNASNTGTYGGPWHGFIAASVPRLVGGYNDGGGDGWASLSNHSFSGSFRVLCLAAYNRALTTTEHQEVYRRMLSV